MICCSDGHAMTMKGADEGGEVGCELRAGGRYIRDYGLCVGLRARAQKVRKAGAADERAPKGESRN